MKIFRFLAVLFLFSQFAVFAAEAVVTTPPDANVSVWLALIPAFVPVVLALLKTLVPKIPKVWLPVLAPVLGAGAEVALHFAGVSTGGVLVGALLGAAGLWLRELADQVRKAIPA